MGKGAAKTRELGSGAKEGAREKRDVIDRQIDSLIDRGRRGRERERERERESERARERASEQEFLRVS